MNESTNLFRHSNTRETYAIKRKDNGDLVGSAGPLEVDQTVDIEALTVKPDNNWWINENAKDLILVSPVELHEDELSKIAIYIHELEAALLEFDTRGFAAEAELPELHRAIERLMELSAQSNDEDFRVLLAMFEKDARDCRKCILRQLGMGN